jgi:hypothetical protein
MTPNLFKSREEGMESAFDGPYLLGVMQLLIERCDEIFGES